MAFAPLRGSNEEKRSSSRAMGIPSHLFPISQTRLRIHCQPPTLSSWTAKSCVSMGKVYPQFNDLLFRRGEPCFYAFDLLYSDGKDWRRDSLVDLRGALR